MNLHINSLLQLSIQIMTFVYFYPLLEAEINDICANRWKTFQNLMRSVPQR